MIIGGRRAPLLLFFGDIAAFAASLYLSLWLRHGVVPPLADLAPYIVPFGVLFALWALVFYMAGLYGKRLALFPSRVPDALLATQMVNIILAAVFFFFVTAFGIAPKTILILYLGISLPLIYFWRLELYPRIAAHRAPARAALIAEGAEAEELANEVNGNPRYGVEFVYIRSPKELPSTELFLKELAQSKVTLVVTDAEQAPATDSNPVADVLSSGRAHYQFAEFEDFYEETFDRVPLSRLNEAWFLKNVRAPSGVYVVLKRGTDIVGGVLMGVLTLVALPFVYLALQMEAPGGLFVRQVRFGERGSRINALKFRSMLRSDSGMWPGEGENRVTKVGEFLRKVSLDEFPQFINILSGELSLVGPRNDLEALGNRLADAIPYYNARYLVKPGITGWAQINQQYEQGGISPNSIGETKTRLAYDFYYLKHRSIALDLVIALKTVKRMFFRVSSW